MITISSRMVGRINSIALPLLWRPGDLLMHRDRPGLPYPYTLARIRSGRYISEGWGFPSNVLMIVEWCPAFTDSPSGHYAGDPSDFLNISERMRRFRIVEAVEKLIIIDDLVQKSVLPALQRYNRAAEWKTEAFPPRGPVWPRYTSPPAWLRAAWRRAERLRVWPLRSPLLPLMRTRARPRERAA